MRDDTAVPAAAFKVHLDRELTNTMTPASGVQRWVDDVRSLLAGVPTDDTQKLITERSYFRQSYVGIWQEYVACCKKLRMEKILKQCICII